MKLTELLRTECIRTGSTVDDKAMALCEVAALAKKSRVLKNISEEAILEALQERETLGTTAFGHGLAISTPAGVYHRPERKQQYAHSFAFGDLSGVCR
jgi:mannitol/fructose-specific phosphotransferase system IIA component (Ntr-type)